MSFKAPAQYPDIPLQRDPLDATQWIAPKPWVIRLRMDGIPAVLSDSTIRVVVVDDDERELTLPVDTTSAADGVLWLSITAEPIPRLGRYTTWRLYESPRWGEVVIQGRFVKER